MDKRKIAALSALTLVAVGAGIWGYLNRALIKRKAKSATDRVKAHFNKTQEAEAETEAVE